MAKKSNPSIRTIVISISSVNTIENKFKENNIEYHFLNINSFNALKNSSLKEGLKKMYLIVKELPDAVYHCHQFHGNFLGVLINCYITENEICFHNAYKRSRK